MKPFRRRPLPGGSRHCLRLAGFLFLAAAAVPAQDAASTYIYDGEGRRMEGPRVVTERTPAGEFRSTEMIRDINGRMVPRESIEERVVSKDADAVVLERVVRRYDPNGTPLAPERIRIEQRKLPDGTVSSVETRSRADLNGNFTVSEVVRTLTESAGGQTRSETRVERPSLSGRLELVEKNVAVEQTAGDRTTGSIVTERRGPSGDFVTVQKQSIERVKQGERTTETVVLYDGSGMGGLQPIQQTVATTDKQADGSVTTQVDLYTRNLPGLAADGKLLLREQQLIRKVPTATGAVETVSFRHAQADGSMPKDGFKKASERVCVGECK